MILIGLTGTLGAGKGTVVDYLVREKGFTHYSVSEFLADEAERRGYGRDRMARHNTANEFRAKGATTLMEAVVARAVQEGRGGERVIIDPQHTLAEVEFIKSRGGIEIAVDAKLTLRYDRIKKRGSEKDNVTYEEFIAVQEKEMSSSNPNENNLGAAIQAAQYHLTNDGTKEELYAQIEEVLNKAHIV